MHCACQRFRDVNKYIYLAQFTANLTELEIANKGYCEASDSEKIDGIRQQLRTYR